MYFTMFICGAGAVIALQLSGLIAWSAIAQISEKSRRVKTDTFQFSKNLKKANKI